MGKAIIKNWGYTTEDDVKVNGVWHRKQFVFVGKCNKSAFIRTVLNGDTCGTQWMTDRMGETRNDFALSLINQHPNKVIKYDAATKQIIKILPILGRD